MRILTCLPLDANRDLIDNLKLANSAMTLWLIVTVYFYYRYEVRPRRFPSYIRLYSEIYDSVKVSLLNHPDFTSLP